MPLEESQAARKERLYCWVTHRDGAITIASLPPHTSTGSWIVERLNNQTPDTENYWVGLHPGFSFKCLMCQTTEKSPRQGSPPSAWKGGATKKDWPERPSDWQLQEARKRLWWGHNTCSQKESMFLHTCHCQGARKSSSYETFAQLLLGQICSRQKCLASMDTGCFSNILLFATL